MPRAPAIMRAPATSRAQYPNTIDTPFENAKPPETGAETSAWNVAVTHSRLGSFGTGPPMLQSPSALVLKTVKIPNPIGSAYRKQPLGGTATGTAAAFVLNNRRPIAPDGPPVRLIDAG